VQEIDVNTVRPQPLKLLAEESVEILDGLDEPGRQFRRQLDPGPIAVPERLPDDDLAPPAMVGVLVST